MGRGYPPPQWGVGFGEGAVTPPQKNFCIFSFEMVHFDAFWKTMEVNCVKTTFTGCTCSTFQQKGRPKIFCADFSGGGVSTPKPPSDYGPVDRISVSISVSAPNLTFSSVSVWGVCN